MLLHIFFTNSAISIIIVWRANKLICIFDQRLRPGRSFAVVCRQLLLLGLPTCMCIRDSTLEHHTVFDNWSLWHEHFHSGAVPSHKLRYFFYGGNYFVLITVVIRPLRSHLLPNWESLFKRMSPNTHATRISGTCLCSPQICFLFHPHTPPQKAIFWRVGGLT